MGSAVSAPAAGEASGDVDVTNVFAREERDGTWTFHVTVEHSDVGMDDFVDGWNVVTAGGEILKMESTNRFTKTLRMPHVNEQPFTRTQKGLLIPKGTKKLRVRAHDKVHGFGGEEVVVDLSKRFGDNFTVRRQL